MILQVRLFRGEASHRPGNPTALAKRRGDRSLALGAAGTSQCPADCVLGRVSRNVNKALPNAKGLEKGFMQDHQGKSKLLNPHTNQPRTLCETLENRPGGEYFETRGKPLVQHREVLVQGTTLKAESKP